LQQLNILLRKVKHKILSKISAFKQYYLRKQELVFMCVILRRSC